MERAYQRLVTPMPGLGEADRRVWRYAMIYPNTTIDLYPDQVVTWRIDPDGPLRARDEAFGYRHPRAGLRTRLAQLLNNKLNTLVSEEDADLVENVQAGLETRGFELGPLSHREAAIAWFADRIRADLGVTGRPRPSRGARERILAAAVERIAQRRHRRGPDRADRDGRRRVDVARPLPLRDPRRAARAGARVLATSWPATCASGPRATPTTWTAPAAGGDDRPVPALPGHARARLDPVGGAVAARRAPPETAPDGGAPVRAHARLVRGGDRRPASSAASSASDADPDRIADRILALADGYGVRVLFGDLDVADARREIWAAIAPALGLPDQAPRHMSPTSARPSSLR